MPLVVGSATATNHISSPFCFPIFCFCFFHFFPRVNFYPAVPVGKMYTRYLQVLSVLNQIIRRKMPQRQQQLHCPHKPARKPQTKPEARQRRQLPFTWGPCAPWGEHGQRPLLRYRGSSSVLHQPFFKSSSRYLVMISLFRDNFTTLGKLKKIIITKPPSKQTEPGQDFSWLEASKHSGTQVRNIKNLLFFGNLWDDVFCTLPHTTTNKQDKILSANIDLVQNVCIHNRFQHCQIYIRESSFC